MSRTPRHRLVDHATGTVVAERLEVPRTPFGRGFGLMFRARLDTEAGMWIRPCKGIHMVGMRFSIDAAFLDRDLRVVRVVAGLAPWRFVPYVRRAHSVVELPAGRAVEAGLRPGTVLALEPVDGGRGR